MNHLGVSLAVFIAGFSVCAVGATYSGRIVDNNATAKPIPNATVFLRGSSNVAYSDSAGRFSLNASTSALPRAATDKHATISFSEGKISFSCSGREAVGVDLFSMNGRKIAALFNRTFDAGDHSFALHGLLSAMPASRPSSGLYIASARKGADRISAVLLLTNKQSRPADGQGPWDVIQGPIGLAKTIAATDSLVAFRMGFGAKSVPVSATTADVGDIVLARDPKEAEIDRKADSIIGIMTIDQKAGQMVQAQVNFTNSYVGRLKDADIASKNIGSVFNGGSDASAIGKGNSPNDWATVIDRVQNAVMNSSGLKIPIIYAQDCVHGVAEIAGCTVFPHNIGLGCTHDTVLAAKVGRITAAEAAAIGIRLNFWPCIASIRNERWGRAFEGFGETPEINALMGAAYIRGLQGDGNMSKAGAVAACAKHFLGDGATKDGVNNGVAQISEATMRAVHLPQYAACGRELMATVMPSYSAWTHDGKDWKQTLDPLTLTTMLKKEIGFDGICVSDWDAILRACGDYSESCVAQAVNAGLDMAMIVGDTNCNNFIKAIKSGVQAQTIPQARVNDAVKRILRIKYRLGLFDHPLSYSELRTKINSAENKAAARECVRKSLVLLKNEDKVLPLKKDEKIVVVGKWADSLGAQCGGWTISWQGATTSTGIAGQTIYDGLKAVGSNVTYDASGSNLTNAEKIVVVVGEKPYAEQYGDITPGTAPDFSSTALCPDAALVQKCYNSGKPVILVMITGRPLPIDTELGWCKAIVAAWLPGGEGGGVADVLFGDYDFSGTLTNTWPASAGQIPINSGTDYSDEQHGSGGAPLYPYGHGLKYNQ